MQYDEYAQGSTGERPHQGQGLRTAPRSSTLRRGAAPARWAILVLAATGALSFPGFTQAARNLAIGVALAHYDREGSIPQLDLRMDVGMRNGPALDLGISTVFVGGELDYGVALPLDVTHRLQITPRLGGTLVHTIWGTGVVGRHVGGRITWFFNSQSGLGFDLSYRTFRTDEIDSAFPILAGAISLARRN